MRNFKHLTLNQIKEYHSNQLSETESNEIGRHLLICEACRKQLPTPSVDQFWSALMIENEIATISQPKEFKNSIFPGLVSLGKMPSTLILGGATLLILICFSFLIWLSMPASNDKIAGLTDQERASQMELSVPDKTPSFESSVPANINRVATGPTRKREKTDSAKPKSLPKNDNQKTIQKEPNKKEQISETRGGSTDCQEESGVVLELNSDKESFVFKWKKVPKAVKYHLYISDDEEILIAEYETESETSFVLKKQLDPLKTYLWRIIITLENGEKIIGSSQKFRAEGFYKNKPKAENKRTVGIRCSAKN